MESLSRSLITRRVRPIVRSAHRAATRQREAAERGARLRELHDAHPDLQKSDLRRDVGIFWLVMPLVAYFVDLFLFSETAEFMISFFPLDLGWLMYLVILFFPVAILTLECFFAAQIYLASQSARRNGQLRDRAKVAGFLLFGVLFAMIWPTFAAANHLVRKFGNKAIELTLQDQFLLAGLIAFSLAVHLAVIISGRTLHEAKVQLLYKIQQRSAARTARRNRLRGELQQRSAGELFTAYSVALDRHNARYKPLAAGPFDADTQRILHQHFGYQVIRLPRENAGAQQTTTVLPQRPAAETVKQQKVAANVPADEAGTNGKLDIDMAVLAAAIRDEESELRP